ncbi:JAB domain-containing protein [Nitrospira sp. Nam80]
MPLDGSSDTLSKSGHSNAKNPYAIPRYRVTLVREGRARSARAPFHDSVGAFALLGPLFEGLDREHFVICGLDAKHRIIGVNVVSTGSLTHTIVHPREIFKPLILMNAAACLCAHNHPSGDTAPSREDILLTKRVREAATLLGIPLLDHLILGDERYYSFADQGWHD